MRHGRVALRAGALHLRTRQGEKATRFIGDIAEFDEAAAFADDVKKIAELGRGLIDLFAGRTFGVGLEPDMHGAAPRVAHIADDPVIARAMAV